MEADPPQNPMRPIGCCMCCLCVVKVKFLSLRSRASCCVGEVREGLSRKIAGPYVYFHHESNLVHHELMLGRLISPSLLFNAFLPATFSTETSSEVPAADVSESVPPSELPLIRLSVCEAALPRGSHSSDSEEGFWDIIVVIRSLRSKHSKQKMDKEIVSWRWRNCFAPPIELSTSVSYSSPSPSSVE